MDFEYQYNLKRKKVEEEIFKVFPDKADLQWLQDISGETSPQGKMEEYDAFCKPARDLIMRGGKRWRPVMMLLSCELTGGDNKALSFVPLVEFPHNGSLIIDDIEDNSLWRRGKEAIHLLYGQDLSINAGNLLYFMPTTIIDKADISDALKLKLYRFYSENLRRLHLGQGFDILWHRNKETVPSPEDYEQMCRYKTGSLARMAAEIGAAVGGGSEKEIGILGSVCEDMGVGFQIMDDVINLTTGNPGKGRGDDVVEGKKSLPVIYHLQEHPDDRLFFQQLFKRAEEKGFVNAHREIEKVIKLLEHSGSVERAREKGKSILDAASKRISQNFGNSEASEIMTGMIRKFYS